MDSGNSGSVQSSSGGDDHDHDHQEFDDSTSRGELSISSFLNPSPNFGSISTPHPHFLTQENTTFFDPQHTQSHTSLVDANDNNNDLFWARGLRSDQHISSYGNFGNFTASSPSTTQSPATRQNLPGVMIKNPKKRTRASHRAPATVLTTDTTNFRQMVQEFTGIPATPFSGSPYSRSLDLLSAIRSGSAHKVLSPFSSSPIMNPTMIDSLVPTASTLGASSSSNNNYPLPSHDHLFNLQDHSGNVDAFGGFQSQEK